MAHAVEENLVEVIGIGGGSPNERAEKWPTGGFLMVGADEPDANTAGSFADVVKIHYSSPGSH